MYTIYCETVLLFKTPAGFVWFQTAQYVVLVHATDQGSPPLSATATVNIDVTDYNDNPPLFMHPNATAVLQVTVKQLYLLRKTGLPYHLTHSGCVLLSIIVALC